MTTSSAIERTPVEIWTQILETVLMSGILPYITFIRGARPFFTFAGKASRFEEVDKTRNVPTTQDFRNIRSVSRSWKEVIDPLGYVFKACVLPEDLKPSEEGVKAHIAILVANFNVFGRRSQPTDATTFANHLISNPKVLQIKLNEHHNDYDQEDLFPILLEHSANLRALTSLELEVKPYHDGIASSLSGHFPRLTYLDIRIRLDREETSILDLQNLRLPELTGLRWDTDRWSLFDRAFPSWELPSLQAVILAANGGCYADSNPTSASLRSFFRKFGRKITHACFYVCAELPNGPNESILWQSVPSLEEIITHPAVEFNGPAPLGSKLTRITVTEYGERCMNWLATTLDLAFDPRRCGPQETVRACWFPQEKNSITICLEHPRGLGAIYDPPSNSQDPPYADEFFDFCQVRGWNLENGTGMPWNRTSIIPLKPSARNNVELHPFFD